MATKFTRKELNKLTAKPRIRHKKMRAFGYCWSTGEVEINNTLLGKSHLITILHEMLHHYNPHWYEYKIRRVSKQMADILWDCRFRRIEKQQ